MRDRLRLRFRKGDDLRFLSHHDLMRCFERFLRRAEIPVARSQGFNPHPKLIFALSLPLGVIGLQEVAELDLEPETLRTLSVEEIHRRMSEHAPPGLEILSVQQIFSRKAAQVRSLCYRLSPLSSERLAELAPRLKERLDSETILIRRAPKQKSPTPSKEDLTPLPGNEINVRPFVRDLRVTEDGLEMELWLTPQGTARPMELLELLGLVEALEQGALLQRAWLELTDELPSTEK